MKEENGPQGQAETTGRKPSPVKLVVEIHPLNLEPARALARERCLQKLEETLGELAAGMAEAWNRPGSWEAGRVTDWLESHYPPVETLREWRREDG